jgi:hypothetical protein
MPGNEILGARLAGNINAETAELEIRSFPDGETYLRWRTSPEGRNVVVVSTLDRPDAKIHATRSSHPATDAGSEIRFANRIVTADKILAAVEPGDGHDWTNRCARIPVTSPTWGRSSLPAVSPHHKRKV